jgi:integrase
MAKKKQRGNGAGTVYPRKNKDGKTIGYRGSYFTLDGKRRYVSAKTKTETQRALREAMTDADRGLTFDAGTMTLGEYLNRWLPNIKDTVRQRTWERYEQIVRVHIKPVLGHQKLKDLTRTHVKGLYSKKRECLSPRTVQYIHVTLHKALKEAVADNLIPRNVAEDIKPSKLKRKEITPLTPEQTKAFLRAARGDRYEALYVIAVHYGLRQGELLGLKWADIDLNAGTLQVRRTMSETRTGRIEEETKSGKGRRIDLSRTVIEALECHRQRQQEEINDANGTYQNRDLVFASIVGTPTNSKNLYYRSFKRILKRAGLPDIVFHGLRHTCATIRSMKGQHLKQVQELLGHSSVAVTLDIYSHAIPGMGGGDVMEDALS